MERKPPVPGRQEISPQMTRSRSQQSSGSSHGGKRYLVKTNCYPMQYNPNLTFYHYQDINPDVKPINRRREILQKLQLKAAPHVFGANNVVGYDGKAALFTIKKLRFDDAVENDIETKLPVNMSTSSTRQGQSSASFEVTLRLVNELPSNSVGGLLGNGQPTENSFTINQIMNIFLLQSTMTTLSPSQSHRQTKTRMFVDPGPGRGSIRGGVELWYGYFINARPSVNRLLLNIDTTVAMMYERGDLIELCRKLLNIETNNVRALGEDRYLLRLKSALKHLLVRQEKGGKRVGKIRTVDNVVPEAGKYEFQGPDGETTVQEYFRKIHGYRLMFPLLPGIKSKKGDVIPFELLTVVEGQMYRRQLDADLQNAMLKASSKRPKEKFQEIENGLVKFDRALLESAGMRVSDNCVTIPARILDPPAIVFKDDSMQDFSIAPKDGEWNLHKSHNILRFHKPCTLQRLVIANFDPEIGVGQQQKFVNGLLSTLQQRGAKMNLKPGESLVASDLNPSGKIENQLYELIGRIVKPETFSSEGFLLLAILPPRGSEIRREVKRVGDVKVGFASQCFMARDAIINCSPAYILNVAMKINARMGGVNSIPKRGGIEWIMKEPTMIIGADVSHPTSGSMRPSIASIAFSLDLNASTYRALTSIQNPRVEKIEDLKSLIKESLKAFAEYNVVGSGAGILPVRIVFYRDGISEGEYQTVANDEFKAITGAVNECYGELYNSARSKYIFPQRAKVDVTFIVVGKRHHVQFFPQDPRHPDTLRNGNCPPGLVVDTDDVSHPFLFDFYLMSHAAIQGTSRPAHYIVIKDENNFSPDELQKLSYALCHNYAVATRSVSIPTPVFYADRVCQRLGIHLRDEDLSSDEGQDKPIDEVMQKWRKLFKSPHEKQRKWMYFV